MTSTALSLTLLLLCTTPTFTYSLDLHSSSSTSWFPWPRSWRRATSANTTNLPPYGYYSPLDSGGSMLTVRRAREQYIFSIADFFFLSDFQKIPVTFPMGQGEPLNAIISGNSDERVLVDVEANGGLRNYFL